MGLCFLPGFTKNQTTHPYGRKAGVGGVGCLWGGGWWFFQNCKRMKEEGGTEKAIGQEGFIGKRRGLTIATGLIEKEKTPSGRRTAGEKEGGDGKDTEKKRENPQVGITKGKGILEKLPPTWFSKKKKETEENPYQKGDPERLKCL